jgi:hypothetical protein
MVANKLKLKPVLKLKLGPSPAPEPVPAAVTAVEDDLSVPSGRETSVVATSPAPELDEFEIAGRASRAEREAANAVVRRALIKRFPNCFKGYKRPKLPLKVGIHRDVLAAAPDLDPAIIKTVIRHYVSTELYHQAMIEGADRVDLDGKHCRSSNRKSGPAVRQAARVASGGKRR